MKTLYITHKRKIPHVRLSTLPGSALFPPPLSVSQANPKPWAFSNAMLSLSLRTSLSRYSGNKRVP